MSLHDGKTCPYCNRPTQYVDSKRVYTKSYGMIYLCEPCGAWVGVHRGTNVALGRLANRELRKWKKDAHKYFDPLWQKKMRQGIVRRMPGTRLTNGCPSKWVQTLNLHTSACLMLSNANR